MDIVQKFRASAHSDPFKYESCWLKLGEEKKEILKFLDNEQEGTKPVEYRIEYRDLERVIEAVKSNEESTSGLIVKVVIQKANMHILPASAASGYWVNLAFLYCVKGAEHTEWYLYGYGKGRYKKSRLNLKRGESLGYSLFVSIAEKNQEVSRSFPD